MSLLRMKIVAVAVVCFMAVCSGNICNAQTRVAVDEDVQVFVLNDWVDGVVEEVKGKQAMVSYEWGGSFHSKVFGRSDIRKMNEVDSLDFSRVWKSAAGGHEIVAAMKKIEGDKVVLLKEDLTELTVELSKLSERDNKYVAKFDKARKRMVAAGQVAMQTPDLPEMEYFDVAVPGSFSLPGWGASLKPLGTLPKYMAFSQKGYGFRLTRAAQELVAIIPVGGPDQLVLVTTRDDGWRSEGEFQSQAYWISMKKSKMVGTVALTPNHHPLDYDPKTKLLLTKYIKEPFDDKPTTYTVWKLPVGGEQAEPIVRWNFEEGTWANHFMPSFAKIINDRIVVAKTSKHTYSAWDFVEKKALYSVQNESFFDVPAVLTHDRKTLLLPEDNQLSVVDAKTGEYLSRLPITTTRLTGANLDKTGTRLIAGSQNNILIWDLEKGMVSPKIYRAPNVGGAFTSRIEWVDDDHVLLEAFNSRVLYRLSLELPVWSYKMSVQQHFDSRDPRKNLMVDGKVFYFAQPDFTDKSKIAIGVVSLPGPGVKETTSNIVRDDLNILKAGVRVAIQTKKVSSPNEVRQALEKKAEANGWIVDANAEIVLKAEMGRGKSQSIVYEEIGGSGRQTVTFAPHYSRLTIEKDDFVLWRSGTSTGAPPILTGKNAQGQVSRMQKADVAFFERVKIPKDIIDPKYSRGFGVSVLGLQGISVVSTTPPGRAADPEAEAQKEEDENQKQANDRRDRGKDDNQDGQGGQ